MEKASVVFSTNITPVPNPTYDGASVRLQMSITYANRVPRKLFVFQRQVPSPGDEDYEDLFYTVASAADIFSLPEDAPRPGESFYRLADLDLVFENEEKAIETMNNIKAMVAQTCRNFDQIEASTPTRFSSYPVGIGRIYAGGVASSMIDAEGVRSLPGYAFDSTAFEVVLDYNSNRYIYVAAPVYFGSLAFKLNNTALSVQAQIQIDIEQDHGGFITYNVWRSTTQHPAGILTSMQASES